MTDNGRLELLEDESRRTRDALHSIDKVLATHLAECSAAQRAVDLRLIAYGDKLDVHINGTEVFRASTSKKISDTQKLIMLGIVISALLQSLNSEQVVKLLAIFAKVLFP